MRQTGFFFGFFFSAFCSESKTDSCVPKKEKVVPNSLPVLRKGKDSWLKTQANSAAILACGLPILLSKRR
jgi:hypothetical protein